MGKQEFNKQKGIISILAILYATSLGLTIIGVPFFLVDSYVKTKKLNEICKNVRLSKKVEENAERIKKGV